MLLLQHTCTTQRYSSVGTNGRKSYTPHLTEIECLALPMDAKSAIQNGFTVSKAWDVFFNDGADVLTGDEIAVNGRVLKVNGVQPFTGLPMVSHLRTLCQEKS